MCPFSCDGPFTPHISILSPATHMGYGGGSSSLEAAAFPRGDVRLGLKHKYIPPKNLGLQRLPAPGVTPSFVMVW